ncbi:dolichyl-phosphate mannose synthase [Nitrosopumilus zosterae]|uniref:Dolichyl-phosphate mannose synthase n=1 Tax=Nitrosopumilus zosterae TaxID=718286 RepID=A0A2S2KUD3_9ARCH|nr:glycosyltransferase family 2 protein [Nitrosopumilus zosterae]BDQ31817.1 glycosyltransferase family 2 protein [Nitrosopumilus zosterae]GBH35167.1 dolichyl-phosphate mannose synthase [Nitrosopumilus zosterae]
MKVIIGIPAFNEERNIGSIIAKLKQKYAQIIVCDDGSSDMTSVIASLMGVHVVKHDKNMGYGSAIKTIFNESKKIEGDVLVTFDADGQHQISEIDSMLKPIYDNKADIVIGSRFLGTTKGLPTYRKIGIKTITGLTNVMTGSKITDSQSGFRAYKKNVIDQIFPTESGMGISTEILIKASKKNMRITEIPITISYENNTHSQEPISHGTSVVMSTVKHVAIERPLLYYGVTGLCFLILGLIFGAWTMQIYSEERVVMTNIALIGIGGVILGTILLITATILYSIVNVVRENRQN